MSGGWRAQCAVAFLAGLLAGLPRADAAERPPNIVLVVVDTLRADRVGATSGPRRGLTPFLDALAARGTRFAAAYAPSSWTCPSVASLLTSRYPAQHRVASFDAVLASDEVSLAESLAPLGYRSAGFTANFRLTADHGYAQGFAFWAVLAPSTSTGEVKVRGGRLREEVAGWLGANPTVGVAQPLFLYAHYLEPHAPYDPPEPFRGAALPAGATRERAAALNRALLGAEPGSAELAPDDLAVLSRLYDGEVAAVDAEIRELFAVLDAAGVLQQAVVMVTADHGEEFGEHGEVMHGHTLYNDAIRIPLIAVVPGAPPGRVVAAPVSLLDLAPTVVALAGGSPEPRHEGRSLLPLLHGGAAPVETPPLLAELLPLGGPDAAGHRLHRSAIVRGGRKGLLGTTGALEVYDLGADPAEQHPLPPLDALASFDLLATLDSMQATLAGRAQPTRLARPLDDAAKEQLRALGY